MSETERVLSEIFQYLLLAILWLKVMWPKRWEPGEDDEDEQST